MYVTKTLLSILESVGCSVKERKGLDSYIEDIKEIELVGRAENAVIVEGFKK